VPRKLDTTRLKERINGTPLIETSCVAGGGIKALEAKLINIISYGIVGTSDNTIVSTVRQRDFLEKAQKNIRDAQKACIAGLSPEFASLDVRLALDNLGMLVGEVVTDDLLEVLFNQFCIGK
jgi:tRNA modification GTPase